MAVGLGFAISPLRGWHLPSLPKASSPPSRITRRLPFGSPVFNAQVRRLQAPVAIPAGGEAALQDAADEQGALGGIGSLAGGEHRINVGDEAGGVGDVRSRCEEELGGDGLRDTLEARGE